jgi:undecaprenyl-diphosphatase
MPVTLLVIATALLAALVVWALSRTPRGVDPVDPAKEERWLVRWLVRHPRFGRHARTIDHHAAGGLLLVVALAVVFIVALVVGSLFDMVGSDTGLARWDRAVADWGSNHATTGSTRVLEWITNFGASGYLIVVAVVIAGFDYARRRNPDVSLFLLTVLGGVMLINNGLKWIVDRERPDVQHLVGTAGSSFPSGHSAAAAASWCAFALVVSRSWPRNRRAIAGAVAAVIAVAVATSRALLGVHWLTDVVAGLVVGWGWFVLSALAFGGRMQRLGDPIERTERVEAAQQALVPTGSSQPPR